MSFDGAMSALFEDLEQQAEGLSLGARDIEVAELRLAEYAEVSLAARVHASGGHDLVVRLLGGRTVTGRLTRVGEDWLLLESGDPATGRPGVGWVLRTAAIFSVAGLSDRARGPETWPVTDRLTLRAVLRRFAGEQLRCVLHSVDDHAIEGRVGRVGQDFLELDVGDRGSTAVQVVPLSSLAALQGGP